MFQHLDCFSSAFSRRTSHPRPQDGVFRCDVNKRCETAPRADSRVANPAKAGFEQKSASLQLRPSGRSLRYADSAQLGR